MKKMLFLMAMMALALCFMAATAEGQIVLGNPFPDFTTTDSEGNAFTLSEALKDHEAALVNIWATWCPPCRNEMPYLNEVYEQYRDRVAFIALSREPDDTMEIIEAYRKEMDLRFPMGRDEGSALFQALGADGIPATAVVDRFGNVVFTRVGSFFSPGEIARVLDAFLGEGYTQTQPLTEIPADTSTRAFPVAARRMIRVENENVRCVLFNIPDDPVPQPVYVVRDDVAHLKLELSADDNPGSIVYYNGKDIRIIQDLLDEARNAYVFDQPMPDAQSQSYYAYASLMNVESDDEYGIYLVQNDEAIDRLAEEMRAAGYEVTMEDAGPVQEEQAQVKAYCLHTVDQDGAPVPGVMVNFCTDTACTQMKSDENGTIAYDGAPDTYHIQVLKVPEGYSFDPDFELYTTPAYGEWLLRIRKDDN